MVVHVLEALLVNVLVNVIVDVARVGVGMVVLGVFVVVRGMRMLVRFRAVAVLVGVWALRVVLMLLVRHRGASSRVLCR
ncbi:MAG: hypothetical protein M3Q17_12025 [Actinomycetota bacterium]|nr:hypothetical protein [Actinomycetota bacterium]